MSATKTTGEQLADQIRSHQYDRDFLQSFLLNFVAVVADEQTENPAHKAARDVLKSLADFDAFVADIPAAKRVSA